MGHRPAVVVVGAVFALVIAAASCAQGNSEDAPLFGAAPPDSGTDAPSAKLPPKTSGDDDDDDDDPDASTTPKGDGGTGTPDSGPGTPTVSAACTAAIAKATWDFENGDQGWTHKPSDGAEQQATWPFDPWSRGVATTIPCPTGACWAGERTQNYAQCSRGELISPILDLSACAAAKVTLVFSHAFAFWTGTVGATAFFDGGIIELSNNGGTSWAVPAATYPGKVKILKGQGGADCVSAAYHADGKSGFTGTQATVAEFSIVVPAAQLTNKTRIRFSTAAGVSTADVGHHRENTEPGWRVDNVRFTAAPP